MTGFAKSGLAVLFVCLTAVMIYFDLIFSGSLPDHRLIVGWNDIVLHTGAFGLLSLLVFVLRKWSIRDFVLLVIASALFELGQLLIPTREVSVSDFFANLAGVVSASLVIIAGQRIRSDSQAGK